MTPTNKSQRNINSISFQKLSIRIPEEGPNVRSNKKSRVKSRVINGKQEINANVSQSKYLIIDNNLYGPIDSINLDM